MVRKRLFGLFTRITRMSERPQLGIMNVFCRPSTVPMAERQPVINGCQRRPR